MSEELIGIVQLKGYFTYCIYQAFNYAVFRFEDEEEGLITVTGAINSVDMKSRYILKGTYVNHPRYGIQFDVLSIEGIHDDNLEGIIAYLSSDEFPGIGRKKAMKIVEHFKLDTLKILNEDPSRITEVNLSKADQATISNIFKTKSFNEDIFYWLINYGFSLKEAKKIFAYYKEETKLLIEDNIFRVYYDIYGIGFKRVEDIALKSDMAFNDPRHLGAYLLYLLSEATFQSGNTYLEEAELKSLFKRYLPFEYFDVAVNNAISLNKLILEDGKYYHQDQYQSEVLIADFLNSFNNLSIAYDEEEVERTVTDLSQAWHLSLAFEQHEAILNFYRYNLSFIVGGPGTGKTLIVKMLVESLKKLYPHYELHVVAPTGRAAKRINELCNVPSSTIHTLLKWDKDSNTFTFGKDNPLLLDVLIIDEFSMVDNLLFAKLLSALYRVKKICIIGDVHQLPSVGQGNLLSDMLKANIFPVSILKTIFRQDEGSEIVDLANDILKGHIDFNKYHKDVFFMPLTTKEVIPKLLELLLNLLKQNYTLHDLQVLAPMYKGLIGIDALNNALQEVFNPPSKEKNEVLFRFTHLRVGDKVLQLKNQSSDDICNGDIGEIVDIDMKEGNLIAAFDDTIVEYRDDDLNNLALAYCISVHKAQGSEYPYVFLLVSNQHRRMLYRQLLYTACSRAAKKLFIIGDIEAFSYGIANIVQSRKSGLIKRLKKD